MQLNTKPKGSTNRVGVIEAQDNRRLKYRAIWRENGKQCSKGFETFEEATNFRNYIENKKINEYKTYLDIVDELNQICKNKKSISYETLQKRYKYLKQANENLINENFKLYKQVKDLIKENNELKRKLQKF